jgi:hypothetical protein
MPRPARLGRIRLRDKSEVVSLGSDRGTVAPISGARAVRGEAACGRGWVRWIWLVWKATCEYYKPEI